MNSGLYDRDGLSATESAAACAKRLDAPITNWSNVYRGFSEVAVQGAVGSGSVTRGRSSTTAGGGAAASPSGSSGRADATTTNSIVWGTPVRAWTASVSSPT